MTTFPFQDLVGVIAWLGGACFCGIVPLGFAAIVFFSARKRARTGSSVAGARPVKAAGLQPGAGLVRLQGSIAPRPGAIDGSAENALVYLRLKVERYESDSDSSGWAGLTDKARSIPFQLEDGTGAVWVNPDGLDKQLLGDGVTPAQEHIEAACILLGISPNILRGQLRFTLWELRAGQTVTVVGTPVQVEGNLVVAHTQGQPFIVSLLLGQAVDAKIITQIWTLILGIPGLLFLFCGLGGAVVTLVRLLMKQ